MKKLFLIVASILLIAGCAAKAPSQSLVENTRQEIRAVQEIIKKIETQTPPECKTEAFMANLAAIQTQVSSIGSQIETIGLSCTAEKREIFEKVDYWRLMSLGLGASLMLFLFFISRRVFV